jgi:deoxyribonuclease V
VTLRVNTFLRALFGSAPARGNADLAVPRGTTLHPAMIAALDVCYGPRAAAAAAVLFQGWADAAEAGHHLALVADVAPYEPGAFYRRELPCLLAVLAEVRAPLSAVVVDGYVWLSDDGHPGLGAHLYDALGRGPAVIGVAKTSFRGSAFAERVVRGGSASPLHVTAAGIDASAAADLVRAMHGPHRMPTLLARADRLCREAMR